MSSKEIILGRFNKAAHTYDRAAYLQKEIANRLIERLQLLREKPKVIVDCGTGTGALLQKLGALAPDALRIGVDFAFNMCQKVEATPGIHLLCADAHYLPLEDACADWVVGNCFLQWSDPDFFFAEAKRVLKPGGVLFLSTFGPDTLMECKRAWAEVDTHPHVHDFADMHDLADILLKQGFEDPVADRELIKTTFEKPIDLLMDLKELGAQNVHPNRQQTLMGKHKLQKFFDAYLQQAGGQTPLTATYEVLYLHANKRKPVDYDGPRPLEVRHL